MGPLPLAFPCEEAPHKDVQREAGDLNLEQASSSSPTGTPEPDIPDKVIEEGDHILATLLPQPASTAEICASQTTSQCLAEAFTWNV